MMAYYPTVWRSRRTVSPWNDLFSGNQRLDRVFDRFFFDGDSESTRSVSWSPVTDVHEGDDGLQVSVELPGLSPDDVSVTVENGVLSISGEKKQDVEEGEEKGNYHLVERRYGRFERTFRLPRGLNSDKVKAKFENGLLKLDIPKSPKAKRKQIEIK